MEKHQWLTMCPGKFSCLCFLVLANFLQHTCYFKSFFPQYVLAVCLLKGQRRCMLPKHTEPLFIVAADGFLQGHDPGGLKKKQALIQLTAWSLKSRNRTKHLCVSSGTINKNTKL
ncbi:hypothetical protein AMECASPLE_027062 [Ameca splendens]|uniref:Secreted protein n=1 Tax=Ameca splendens TaxID=208324 RepID=A0ABV0Z3X0_9TELE